MKKLILSLSLLLICSISLGQEVAKNRVFSMTDFSGGQANKMSDHSLTSKYAELAENVRLNSSLTDIDKRGQLYLFGTADASEAITGSHRLYLSGGTKVFLVTHGDELEAANDTTGVFTPILDVANADYRWDFVTWHDLALGGDGYNYNVKTDGTDATYMGTCFAEDSGAGGNPDGTYTYKFSFYTATKEVIFDVASPSVTVVTNKIDLSMIPVGPDTFLGADVVGRKIYRNAHATPAVWQLAITLANNVDTTDEDDIADGALGANYPAGDATWTPPKCKLWLIHKNRLFGANNPSHPSRIYYSKDGSHDLFENTDYFDIRKNDGGKITCIENLLGLLTIAKDTSWQKLLTNGDDPSADWEITDPLSTIGCDAMYSAANTPIGIMYLSCSKDGIYVFNGQNSKIKSEKITPTIQDILPTNLTNVVGEYNNNIYYLAYSSNTVGKSTNNRVLVYDMLADAFMVDLLSINEFCSFDVGEDGGALFAGASDSGKIYQYSSVAKTVIHSRHSDFSGTFDDARYIPEGYAAGGDASSPVIELSWDLTVDGMAGTVNAASGDVDRPDGTGTYASPSIHTPNASTYDKLYWNETLEAGCDVTFDIRSDADDAAWPAWAADGYTIAAGSDISGETAREYTQYRINLTSTTDIDYTPNIYTLGGFTVKLTYNTVGTAAETAVALHWRTGFLDFGEQLATYEKSLRQIFVFLEGESGSTVTITVTNEYGDSDTFEIDTDVNPTFYSAYFTDGALMGRQFQFDITNSDLNKLRIKEVHILFDVEPIY